MASFRKSRIGRVILCVWSGLLASALLAQSVPTPAKRDPRVSIVFRVPFRKGLKLLFQQAGQPYRIASDIPCDDQTPIPLEVDRIRLSQALHRFLFEARHTTPPLTFQFRNGVYSIRLDPHFRVTTRKVTLHLKQTSLDKAMQALLDQTEVNYVYTAGGTISTDHITLDCNGVTFEEAFARILTAGKVPGQLQWRLCKNRSKTDVRRTNAKTGWDLQTVVAVFPGQFQPETETHPHRLILRLRNADLYQTLHALFRCQPAQFSVDPALRDNSITLSYSGPRFTRALDNLLKASGLPVTYEYENGIYAVIPIIEEGGVP